ncbi:cell division control protein cdc31 protein [Apiospora arundinis]
MATTATTTMSSTATTTGVISLNSRQAGSTTKESTEPQFPDVNAIRKAIPTYCFQPTVARSMSYVVRDLAFAGALVYGALTFIPQLPNPWVRAAAWAAYTFAQGLVGTGLWILAHECGHGAFSLHRGVNDFVGWALHSLLGVPYFSWKFSHARHHQFTGHMHKDMAFVPATREDHERKRATQWWHSDLLEDAPAFVLLKLIGHQLFAWPTYLLFNVSSGPRSLQPDKNTAWYRVSHFDPFSAVFRPNEAFFILLSDIGLGLVGLGLYFAAQALDAQTVFLLWGIPWFWVHHWLIAITYLHHNHPDVKHYDENGWTFVKGALATVDRDFGWIDRYLFHGIIGTHVVHHLFARIPFYYAEDATEAIKPMLGDLYHQEKGSFYGDLWTTFNHCKYVENDPAMPGVMKWNKRG